jgi:hypothetical protein
MLVLVIIFNVYTGEIWLNTTNSQSYILLTLLLILVEDAAENDNARKIAYAILLAFAGLNSPYIVVLAPLFIARWIAERKPAYRLYAIVVGFTLLVQVLSASLTVRAVSDDRFGGFTWSIIPYVAWSRILMYPVLGVRTAEAFASFALDLRGDSYWLYLALGAILSAALIVILAFLAWPLSRVNAVGRSSSAGCSSSALSVGAFGLVLGFSIITSATHGNKDVLLSPLWSPRYFFVPSVLFFVIVLSNVRFGPGRFAKARAAICLVVLVLALFVGLTDYSRNLPFSQEWPDWRHEVSIYRRDPTYRQLQIWPPGWTVRVCDW